jgi:hypothetical protein
VLAIVNPEWKTVREHPKKPVMLRVNSAGECKTLDISQQRIHTIFADTFLQSVVKIAPLQDPQPRLREQQLASTAQAFFESGDTEKLRCTRICAYLASREHVTVPFRRLQFSLFLTQRGPQPFHGLKPLCLAEARYLVLQFKDTHR